MGVTQCEVRGNLKKVLAFGYNAKWGNTKSISCLAKKYDAEGTNVEQSAEGQCIQDFGRVM